MQCAIRLVNFHNIFPAFGPENNKNRNLTDRQFIVSTTVKDVFLLFFFYWCSGRFSTFGRYLKKMIFPPEKLKILRIFPQIWSSDPP